jgi:protein TonB
MQSSGSNILDRETLTLVERAQPLPPPPPEVTGSQIPIVVSIRYNAR